MLAIPPAILPFMKPLNLKVLPGEFSVVRLGPGAPVPRWALSGSIFSVTGTTEELSIVCEAHLVPVGLLSETGWRALKVLGPLAFTDIGVLAALVNVLADCRISVFVVSTYDTDYILLKNSNLQRAIEALAAAGNALNS